ncbi:hypothetical protein K3495_g11889 [Podosphaera aphanis]|nr:hypothetical protein K3495_g11889 [Podosphaera aphanis]
MHNFYQSLKKHEAPSNSNSKEKIQNSASTGIIAHSIKSIAFQIQEAFNMWLRDWKDWKKESHRRRLERFSKGHTSVDKNFFCSRKYGEFSTLDLNDGPYYDYSNYEIYPHPTKLPALPVGYS